jgi:hypothetical protein
MAVPIVIRAGWIVPILAVILLVLIVLVDVALESVSFKAGPTLITVIVIAAIAYKPMGRLCESFSDKATQRYHQSQNANRQRNKQRAADLIKRGNLRSSP